MKSSTFLGLGLLLLISIGVSETAKSSAKNGQSLKNWLRSMRPKRNENSLASDRIWTLADALPGEPGRDYPIFATAPETGFSCDDKHYGYYADIEARCQVFHICANTAGSAKGFEFLCPNGTLFNQRFFVCDWYMNVDCEGSEKYYNLNDLIGDSMNGFTHNDVMSTAKDIMSFTKQPSTTGGFNGGRPSTGGSGTGGGNKFNGGDSNNRRTGSAGGRPTNGGSGSFNGNVPPLRGSANLAQPTEGGSTYPGYSGSGSRQGNTGTPSGISSKPYSGSATGGGPQRGANGGTVYVNSLGQLSTDKNSGFDPKHSFIIRPDKDSKFDQDTRIPSNSFDILKGVENSYSFGFPDDLTTPLRGSADLSEPVDPSLFGSKGGPAGLNGNRKQIYTYPHDQNGYQQSSIPPEQQGQLNTKLSAQAPKYPATQVYGPALSQPGQFGSPSGSSQGYPQEEYPGSNGVPSSQLLPQNQYPSSSQRGPSSQSSYPQTQGGVTGQNYPQSSYPSSQRGPTSQGYPTSSQYPSSQGGLTPQRTQYPSSQNGQTQQNIPQRTQYPSSQNGQTQQNIPQRSQYPSSQNGQTQQNIPQRTQYPSSQNGQTQRTQYPSSQARPGQQYVPPRSQYPSAQAGPRGQATNGQRGPSTSSQSQSFPPNPFTQRGQSTSSFPPNQLSLGDRTDSPQSFHQSSPQRPSSSSSLQPNTLQQNIPQSYQPSQPSFDPNSPAQPQKLYQQPHSSNVPQSYAPISNQQQTQRRQFDGTPDNRNYYQNPQAGVRSGSQSNEDYLRVVLKDKNNVHDDNMQLIELIQRFFVPQHSQTKVVSAHVHPSTEQESYSFTYDGNGDASNIRNSYQQPNHSGYHRHSNTCGHQGY